MAGFSEPTTEQEAQELKRFLEQGARTTVEVTELFEAILATGEAMLGNPAVLSFDVAVGDLLARGTEADRRVYLQIEVSEVRAPTDYVAAVFLNNPEARAESVAEDPSFVWAIGFFCDIDENNMCVMHHGPTMGYAMELGTVLGRLPRADEPLSASIVLVPTNGAPDERAGIVLKSAAVSIVESRVEQAR